MALKLASSNHEPAPREALSDRDLLEALRRADESALGELIRRKSPALVQAAYRIVGDLEDAKDVVQMAFVRIWDHRSRYDAKWSPNTWIYRITTNLAIDLLRSRQSRDRIKEPLRLHLLRGQDATGRRTLDRLGDQEVGGIFAELAENLTERQRAIFVLREIEGLSSAEVADIVGCRESTVRNHLFNARKLLRTELLQRFPEYGPKPGAGS